MNIDFTIPQALIVTASKPLVDKLLAMNTHNRKIRQSQVDALKKDLNDGRWLLTNQGIGVTKSGFVPDGQHRLEAIRQAGYPAVKFVLVTGLDDNAQAVVDTQTRRSQSDIIALLLDQTISNQAVAALNIVLKISSKDGRFTFSRERTNCFDLAEAFSDWHDILVSLLRAAGSSMRAPVTAALIEYAFMDLDSACELAEQIKTGIDISGTSPAYRLRQYLSKNRGGGASTQLECYSMTVTACIAHSRGDCVSLLRPSGSWSRLSKKSRLAPRTAA